MLRLSKLADYAVVVLAKLADGDAVQTSPTIASATGLPEPTVAKVLKGLASGALVTSQRGARGGYRLLRPLDEVSVADVVTVIDGPVHMTACVDGSPASCQAQQCCCRGGWDQVNEAVMNALGTISIAHIVATRSLPHQAAPDHLAPALPASTIPAE